MKQSLAWGRCCRRRSRQRPSRYARGQLALLLPEAAAASPGAPDFVGCCATLVSAPRQHKEVGPHLRLLDTRAGTGTGTKSGSAILCRRSRRLQRRARGELERIEQATAVTFGHGVA